MGYCCWLLILLEVASEQIRRRISRFEGGGIELILVWLLWLFLNDLGFGGLQREPRILLLLRLWWFRGQFPLCPWERILGLGLGLIRICCFGFSFVLEGLVAITLLLLLPFVPELVETLHHLLGYLSRVNHLRHFRCHHWNYCYHGQDQNCDLWEDDLHELRTN